MTQPLPWSHTRLTTFKNCPYRYYEETVLKKHPYVEGPEQKWGNFVHKAFEDRVAKNKPLPQELREHDAHLDRLINLPGELMFAEQKIALRRVRTERGVEIVPCGYWEKEGGKDVVWYRGQIDFMKIWTPPDDCAVALIEDYKTGKIKNDFGQLKLFALWVFAKYPQVMSVTAQFYWTTDKTTPKELYTREQIPQLWGEFAPDLKQYVEAFKTDTWQKRQSGLCGWCPVKDCEHWFDGPARKAARGG